VNLGGATFSVVGFAGVDFVLEAVGLDGAGFEGVDFAAGGFEEDGLGEEGLEETFDDVFSLTGAVFEKKDLDGAEAFGGGGFAADALDGVGVGVGEGGSGDSGSLGERYLTERVGSGVAVALHDGSDVVVAGQRCVDGRLSQGSEIASL